MRLLHCIHSLNPEGGGPAQLIVHMAAMQKELGVTVEAACLDSPDDNFLADLSCRVHAMGPAISGYGYSHRFVPWLNANCGKYDLVVVHGIWQFPSIGTWLALHGTDTPYVVFTHGMLDPWFNRHYPLKHIKKSIYWILAEHHVLQDAKAVLFTSEEERILAAQSFRPYDCRQIVVGHSTAGPPGENGDLHLALSDSFPQLVGKRIILYLGRMHEKKGIDLLLTAFLKEASQDSNLHLVIAGPLNGAYAQTLRQQFEQSAGDTKHRVTWTGMLQGDLKWEALKSAEVLVLPSHQENFGIVVAEALSCGTPVLISNKVNIWREVEADKAGLVGSDDLESTQGLLREWLSFDRAKMQEMRSRARMCFARRFDSRQVLPRLVDVFKQLSKPRQPGV